MEGGLCESQVPPLRHLGDDHWVKCHLDEEILRAMEPVIVLSEQKAGSPRPLGKDPQPHQPLESDPGAGISA